MTKHAEKCVLFACAALFTALSSADVYAYCRAVSQKPPADYDLASQGCFTGSPAASAKELFWGNACVGYSIQKNASTQVTLDQASAVVKSAFQRWTDAACPGGQPNVRLFDLGPVECDEVRYNKDRPNQNVIVFRDDDWPYNDPNNTLGLTTMHVNVDTGEIWDADMEINSKNNVITVSDTRPPGGYDLASIITHEAGHFLGMAHSSEADAVMYAQYHAGSTTLTADDVTGICAIYPGDGTRSTSAGPAAAAACDTTPRHGFSSECAAAPLPDPAAQSTAGCAVARAGVGQERASLLSAALIALTAVALRVRRRERRAGYRWALSMALLAAVVCALVPRRAQASVSIAILFTDLVQETSAVAVVTPVEQLAVWENGRIYTYTRMHVDTPVAGELPDATWVRTMGGTVGNIAELVDGEAVFTIGRSALLFLRPQRDRDTKTPTGVFEVTARGQGQFPVIRDERGALRVIRARGMGTLLPPPPERLARAEAIESAPARLASETLRDRSLDDAAAEVAVAFARLHAR